MCAMVCLSVCSAVYRQPHSRSSNFISDNLSNRLFSSLLVCLCLRVCGADISHVEGLLALSSATPGGLGNRTPGIGTTLRTHIWSEMTSEYFNNHTL